MAYAYADWAEQTGNQAKYDRLVKHIGEVSALVGNERGSGPNNVGSSSLVEYLKGLREDRKELAAMPGVSTTGTPATSPVTTARFVARRNVN